MRITVSLNFIRPFKTGNVAEFTLEHRGGGTAVTWAMRGPMPYISRPMRIFFDMDTMLGGDFETGLADPEKLAER